MPALLMNLKIDVLEKSEFFKVTLTDVSDLFDECHVKIRGKYSQECIKFAQGKLGRRINLYQDIQECDWVTATLEMLNQVKSRSVFLYFEDHKLVANRQRLEQTLAEFDQSNLDYLCYSFFRASQLDVSNLLPLNVVHKEFFSEFDLSDHKLNLLGKISPNYYTFSLVSVVSVDYFRDILSAENTKYKIFNKWLTSVISRLFAYPSNKKTLKKINLFLSFLYARLCIYPPSSPFNLEKVWFEFSPTSRKWWKFGVLKQELFANYDDDNGAYGESLIKKGLYPFEASSFSRDCFKNMNNVAHQITLKAGEMFDCTYYSHVGRIRNAPIVQIHVVLGGITVHYKDAVFSLSSGEEQLFYSNLRPVINCVDCAELRIKLFDEIF